MAAYEEELLTEEERAAFAEDEGSDTAGAANAGGEGQSDATAADATTDADDAVATGDDTTPDDDAAGANGEDTTPAGDDTQPAAAEGEEASAQPEPDPEPKPAPQEAAAPPAPDVDMEQVENVLGAYEDKRKGILDKFDDGEMTREEFQSQMTALDDERVEATVNKRMVEDQQRKEEARWNSAVGAYLDQYPDIKGNQELLQRFDQHVRQVTADPDFAHLTYAQQLAHAHAQWAVKAQALGVEGVPDVKVAPKKKAEQAQKKPDPKPDPKPQQRAADEAPTNDGLGDAPQTLARAPASEITGGSDDKFAALRQMEKNATPDEYEAAVARLSPDERDQYSSMA
ncbi:hypothetical protein [Sediminimonas sp.]|uniref:hypothetical protein n=1 Tax=Sediminimonas sp. TaxID=2823379 RepID=UPI0025D064FC|nr:hypothetical protein [Sediminimonas sp.]